MRSSISGLLTSFLLFAVPLATAQDLSGLFEQVKPAVVVLKTQESFVSPIDQGMKMSMQGLGSGVLIDDRRILTAAHVVQAADLVLAHFHDGQEIFAKVVASSPTGDVALLELEEAPQNPSPVPIGDSDNIQVGEQIFVVGAPYGLAYTLTVGHISGRISPNDIGNNFTAMEFLQTDAAINQGNSGGPMFNMDGEIIGIVSHILSQSGGFEGLGFAASSNMTTTMLLEENSFWSGAEFQVLSGELARIFNVPQEEGILIQRVAEESPADRLGLRPSFLPLSILGEEFLVGGDIILEVMGIRVGEPGSNERMRQQLNQLKPGYRLYVEVLRGGQRETLSITL